MDVQKEIKGWSWLGFLFMPYYYAGYGDLKKGLIAAVFLGIIGGIIDIDTNKIIIVIAILLGLLVAIYGGMQAKKELPVKKQKFSWLNVFYTWMIYFIVMLIVSLFFVIDGTSTPKCNDIETKKLVKQISLQEFAKQGIDNLNMKLSNVLKSSYNKETKKYECAAKLTATDTQSGQKYSLPITYSSQSTEDGNSFYVEVFGL